MMVPQDEFIMAMICAMFFGACTFLLLVRGWMLKRQIKKLKLAQTKQAAPAPSLPFPAPQPQPDPQITELKERIKVLERITVDRESSLSREIELLRDRA